MALPIAIKYIINGGVVASLIGGIGAFKTGNVDLGLSLVLATPIIVLAPRLAYKKFFQKHFGLIFLAEIEALVLTFLILSIFGELFFYANIPAFDSFIHFVSGILIAILLVAIFFHKYIEGKFKPSLIVLFGGVIPAFLNEIYEATADALFGSQLWGDIYWTNFKPLWTDTISDIILQILGAVLAVYIIKAHFNFWLKRWRR